MVVLAALAAGNCLQGLVISGSDLFGERVRQVLQAELAAAGVAAEIRFDGSLLGLRDLEAGTVDVGLLAITDARSAEVNLRKYPVAYQIVTFLVHTTNPVMELSYADLYNLYQENGTISDWSALTTDSRWSDRKVSLRASRRENRITLELFNELVLEGAPLKQAVRYTAGGNAALLAAVTEDPTALVLAPGLRVSPPVKALAVKRATGDRGFTPSQDNVFFGDYPLRLPFYLVVGEAVAPETVGALLRVLYGDAVTQALAEVDYLPVPEQEQRSILFPFDS
jgi:ABC-type phosphate transport system substrate-binding protein